MSVKLLVLALLTPLSIAARIPVMLVGLPSGTQRLELSVLSLSPAVIATVFNVPPDQLADYGWGSPPTDFNSDFSQVKGSIEAELGSAMLSDSSLLYEQKYLIVRLNMATPTVPYDPAKQAQTAASASFANAVNPGSAFVGSYGFPHNPYFAHTGPMSAGPGTWTGPATTMNMNYGTAVGAGVAMPGQSHPTVSSKASRKRNGDHLASTPVSAMAPNAAAAPAKKAKPPPTIKYAVKELGRGKDKKYDGKSYVIEVCASGLAVRMPCVNVCLVRAPQFPADSDPTVQMLADEAETLTGYKVELFTSSLAMLGNGRSGAPLPSPQAHLIIWFQKYRPKFKPASTDDVFDCDSSPSNAKGKSAATKAAAKMSSAYDNDTSEDEKALEKQIAEERAKRAKGKEKVPPIAATPAATTPAAGSSTSTCGASSSAEHSTQTPAVGILGAGCRVCGKPAQMVANPCGHIATCQDCVEREMMRNRRERVCHVCQERVYSYILAIPKANEVLFTDMPHFTMDDAEEEFGPAKSVPRPKRRQSMHTNTDEPPAEPDAADDETDHETDNGLSPSDFTDGDDTDLEG